MAWSTRQLAELAGTTVKAVRHYHEAGLLEMPERAANGYKQYRTAHLVRLIHITRLKDLGIPLSDIAAVDDTGQDLQDAIRVIDEELSQTISRLQRVRAELAVLLTNRAPLTTPSPFEQVAGALSERDRSLITVYSQVLQRDALDDVRQLMTERGDEPDEFDLLPEDADGEAVDAVAEDLASVIRQHQARFPWMADVTESSTLSPQKATDVIVSAVAELYNEAQLKALAKAHQIIAQDRNDT